MKVYFNKQWLITCWLRYADNHRVALKLIGEDGSPYMSVSVNIPVEPIGPLQLLIKDWSENHGILEALEKAKVVRDTGRRVDAGFEEAHLVDLTLTSAREMITGLRGSAEEEEELAKYLKGQ